MASQETFVIHMRPPFADEAIDFIVLDDAEVRDYGVTGHIDNLYYYAIPWSSISHIVATDATHAF